MRFRGLLARLSFAIALAIVPSFTHAQGFVSAGLGVGGAVGDRNKDDSGSGAHALAFVLLHPPLLPVGIRADALFSKVASGSTALSLIGDAIFLAPLPIVQPYALLGYGRYGVGKSSADQASGFSAGVGVRLHLPSLSLFGEARYHQRISHNLLTVGIAL